MKLLIDHGANKDLKDSKNKTPLESEELLKKEYNEEKEVFKSKIDTINVLDYDYATGCAL